MPISHFTFSCFPLSLSLAPAALSTRSIAPSLPAHGPPLGLSPHTHPLPPGRLPHGQAGYLERPRCPVISMEKGLWHPADSTPRPSPAQIVMWLKRFSFPVCHTPAGPQPGWRLPGSPTGSLRLPWRSPRPPLLPPLHPGLLRQRLFQIFGGGQWIDTWEVLLLFIAPSLCSD